MTSSGTTPPGARYLLTVVLAVVLLQRLAIPAGEEQVPVTVPVVLALTAVGLALGHLRLDRTACLLLGPALGVLAALTALAALAGRAPSLASLVLLTAIYVPAVTVAADRAAARVALGWFVAAMAGLAGLGTLLFAGQLAGLPSRDYLADLVPEQLLQDGFNTGDPIGYGSPLIRSNGVVFLEPSIFSLFLGLAVVVSIGLRKHRGLIPLLLAGIACTTAGNGVAVVGVSCVVLALVGPARDRLLVMAPVAVAIIAFAALTPLGGLFVQRATEVVEPNSSASLRLVQPYQELGPPVVADPLTLLVGQGAGSAGDYIAEQNPTEAVVVPAVPKLVYEYGVLGLLPVLAFLVLVMVHRGRRAAWMPGLAVAYFVLNPSLQLATVAIVSYLFLSVLAGGALPPQRRPRREADDRQPARAG